jgi:cell division protein FtsW
LARYAPTHFLTRHAFYLVMGFVAALLAFQMPMAPGSGWPPGCSWLLLLLVVVLVPGVGKVVNGARRWLSLGPMNFQPSELAKFAVLIYAADYMVRKMDVKERFFRAVLPMGRGGGGRRAAAGRAGHGRLHGGGRHRHGHSVPGRRQCAHVLPDRGVLVAAFAMMIASSPWRRERMFAYLDPFSEQHALGKGYQLSHALIAIGRGEVFGVGLGGSVEKLHWLPEAHTDFLLAVIGEEFGLVGVLVLIVPSSG